MGGVGVWGELVEQVGIGILEANPKVGVGNLGRVERASKS